MIAGAAFGDILKRLRTPGARAVLFAAVTAVAIFDLSVGYEPTFMPACPDCYAEILRRDPRASFLEVPQNVSGGSLLNAATGYWQSLHQGRTSGGYSGHANAEFNRRLSFTSPFLVSRWPIRRISNAPNRSRSTCSTRPSSATMRGST